VVEEVGKDVLSVDDIPTKLTVVGRVRLHSEVSDDVATVRGAGKEIMMMEMNSASCGGFAGLSDSFGVAMW
jgi:hypothetical protein